MAAVVSASSPRFAALTEHVDQDREKLAPSTWIKVVRKSSGQLDQARENHWIMSVRNDSRGRFGRNLRKESLDRLAGRKKIRLPSQRREYRAIPTLPICRQLLRFLDVHLLRCRGFDRAER